MELKCNHCNGYGKCKCINCFRKYFDETEVTDHEFASFTERPEVPCEVCKGTGKPEIILGGCSNAN